MTSFFGYQLQFLQADFEFEKFFPLDDPDIAFYEDHLQKFNYDNDYFIIILENNQGIFEKDFLVKADSLAGALKGIENIDQVISPTGIKHLIKGPLGVTPIPLVHVDEPKKYATDSIRIFSHPVYRRYFARSAKSLMLQVIHEHIQDPDVSNLLVQKANVLLESYGFDNYRVVGKLVAQKAFINLIQKDFGLFLGAALILSFILLVLLFKSIRIALLPYLISITSLVWLLGLMALLGYPITILGSLIPPVILFVSSSDAIHLINGYRNNHIKLFTERLNHAVKKVFFPTLLTSITTAIGFFSLITINTSPIQMLGIFTGIGVLMAFVITYVFGPLLINQSYPTFKPSHTQKRLAIWVLNHPKTIFTFTGLLVALSGTGIFFLKTDAYLLEDLPKGSGLRKDFNFVDEKYGGSKPWELAYWPADSSKTIWDRDIMEEAVKIHSYLIKEYPIESVWSPVTLIKYGNQMTSGGSNTDFNYPEKENHSSSKQAIRPFTEQNELPKLIANDQKYARFAGYIPEYGSAETIHRNKQLLDFMEAKVNNNLINYRLTGTTYLIDKSHELLSANLLKGLLIAVALISLLLGIYFKSFNILLISIFPNIIPLLATAGFMGWMDISLKLTTSIIFAVAFGIVVDDTIHFISYYRKQHGKNRVLNLIRTFQVAGKAIVITSLILVAGFSLLIFSSFGATYFLGLFMCISLVVAVLIDLTFLPLLLHFSSKVNRHGTNTIDKIIT